MRSTRPRQRGFVTIEHLLIVGLGLVVLTWAANLVVVQYVRGVTRLAVDEGVRAAAIEGPGDVADACELVAAQALDDLLRGAIGDTVRVTCASDVEVVRGTATGSVASWIPGIPTWSIDADAEAARPDPLP